MNKNTYHFEHLRLHCNPQTRISSQHKTSGFTSLDECKQFCNSIGFDYNIVYYDNEGIGHNITV